MVRTEPEIYRSMVTVITAPSATRPRCRKCWSCYVSNFCIVMYWIWDHCTGISKSVTDVLLQIRKFKITENKQKIIIIWYLLLMEEIDPSLDPHEKRTLHLSETLCGVLFMRFMLRNKRSLDCLFLSVILVGSFFFLFFNIFFCLSISLCLIVVLTFTISAFRM